MLNGVSLSSVIMIIGVLLIVLALWRLLRVFRPTHRRKAAPAETTRQEPDIGLSASERGE